MYRDTLHVYASHGFVVLFPYIKSPNGDKNPLTTNTNGEYLLHAIDYARAVATNASYDSPLLGRIDTENMVVAGHSMGATCSIMAGKRLPEGSVKLVVTQHPGICGPFGPPPWPATWLKSDLEAVQKKFPVVFTTATNDGAFWPAPYTASHELGCFSGGAVNAAPHPASFVQFSEKACAEDGAHKPFTDAGHNCPFKTDIETPWVLAALKLYAHLDGQKDSACWTSLYGNATSSLSNSPNVEKTLLRS